MRVRYFGFLLLALTSFAARGEGHGYVPVPNPEMLLEHLVRHSDLLVTNINLTRASGFRVENVVVQAFQAQQTWGGNFYSSVIAGGPAAVRAPQMPDFVGFSVGQIAYTFRMKVIALFDTAMNYGPGPTLVPGPGPGAGLVPVPGPGPLQKQFMEVDFAYFNAISATYFYIEALRRGYLLPQAPFQCRNKELLLKRLTLLQQNAIELQNLMYSIRYAAAFRFPLPASGNCIECSFAPFRMAVNSPGPIEPVFPYYANNRVVFPENQMVPRLQAPAQFNPMYSQDVWNSRWNVIDQGYLQPQTNPAIAISTPRQGIGMMPGINGGQGGLPGNDGQGLDPSLNAGNTGINPQQGGLNPVQPNPQGQQPYGPQPLINGGQAGLNGGQPGLNNGQPGLNGGQGVGVGQPLPLQNGSQQGVNQTPAAQVPAGSGQTGGYTPAAYDY